MKIFLIVLFVCLVGCSRPDDGFKDGQVVYLKTTCEKVVVTHWNTAISLYEIANQKDKQALRRQDELTATTKDCVNWNK